MTSFHAKFANLKTKPKVLLGICLPITLLLVLGGVSVYSINSIVKTNKWVQHTNNVLAEASGIVGSAVDMETGMRGYLLAGQEGFLDPYNQGQEATYSAIEELRGTVSDNPGQVERLNQVEATLREWQDQVTEPTIALRREIGDAMTMNDMSELVGEARGKKYFDKFRGQIATFIGREQELLEQRSRDLDAIDASQLVSGASVLDTVGWVTHTYKVIAQANDILAAAVDMETGMRGYLLAGLEGFLEPYTNGAKIFYERVASLRETVDDNPAQVELLNEIEVNIKAWQADVTEPAIALRREIGDSKTMDDMADLVGEARGKVYFDGFRGLMVDFKAEEQGLMEERRAANELTVRNTFVAIAACVVIALLIGLLLAWAIGNGIANPITKMTGAMKRLAEGDHAVEVPGIDRLDEVGEMASAVQVFKDNAIQAEELGAKQRAEQEGREQRAKRIEGLCGDFDKNVKDTLDQVSAASTEMRSTAEGMAGSAQQASEQSTAVAGATEESSANVQTVAAASEELSSSITEISRQVSGSREVTEKAQVTSKRASETIQNLAEMARKIGDVVNLINDIAEQTNLLALNATIEAARAGDAGKGFAVVASEVKNLASQTAKATEEISGQISGMQASTDESVKAIEDIQGVIVQLGETATAIASAVEQQNASTQEISRNAQEAATGSQDVSNNITSVQSAIGETGAAASQVLSAANELSQQSEGLSREIDKFLTDIRAA